MGDKVLLIGSGGREHAIAWKLAQSEEVGRVLVAPGNAGTATSGKVSNIDVSVNDHEKLADWCQENKINLVVIGPEAPLAAGVVDVLSGRNIPCFGPTKAAAEIEASKAFAKDFMDRHDIPTARWKSFTEAKSACEHINSAPYKALVVKASGLAAGKGVIVAKDKQEACAAVNDILQVKRFGEAGEIVVVEELLEGEEFSVLAFSDGTDIAPMLPAQDHKRLQDGDQGPNTGGMGAYCPCPQVNSNVLSKIHKEVLQQAVDGMKQDGKPYVGVLYAGLMLTRDGAKCLEFNCRFGDPETQVILPLLKSDLYQTMKACAKGELPSAMPQFHDDKSAVAIVLASGGYPASYKKGHEITGLDIVEKELKQVVFHAGTSNKEGKVVTSGGRVLANVATASDLPTAAAEALKGAQSIKFEGAFFRRDIAKKGCEYLKTNRFKRPCLTYADCGVDIAAGNSLVDAIKPLAAQTARLGCDASLGGFGGVFDVKAAGYQDPILVSGTDGVGTKLKIAQSIGIHDTIGIDLVAMCVNDILANGAEALFFLDYFACGKLDVGVGRDVVSGVAEGCKLAGCALLGGETAEMPGMYAPGDYDLAGFAVGAVERGRMLPRIDDIVPGDVVIGVASSGVHSNGFSLVRAVVKRMGLNYQSECPYAPGRSIGEELLTPTKIYAKTLLPAVNSVKVKAYAHITGGGLVENIPRVLPKNLAVQLDASNWTIPPVFGWVSKCGEVREEEMARTFNCGVGAALIVKGTEGDNVIAAIEALRENAWCIGKVVEKSQIPGPHQVSIHGLSQALERAWTGSSGIQQPQLSNGASKLRVAVLISGTDDSWACPLQCADVTKPWVSHDMMSLIQKRKTMYRATKRAPENVQLGGAYKKFRNQVTNQLRQAKLTYTSNSIAVSSRLGTNLQALIDHTQDPAKCSHAEIALVISNIPGVQGLERAEKAGIPTQVIPHKGLKRVTFDMKVHDALEAAGIQFVCLAGFMRILSGEFVNNWRGRLINIHPSLLPSFKGMNAHKLVLESGVRLSGCSVHYVVEEVDAGAILVQESVPVYPGDTEETLQERVKTAEHKAYPNALELVARGVARMGEDGKVVWKVPEEGIH